MHLLLLVFCCAILSTIDVTNSQESPGFFLKVTKNVPRLGRRSDSEFEKYFRKAYKSVPRIGRRSEEQMELISTDEEKDQKMYPSKRMIGNSPRFYEYNVVQPVNTDTLMEILSKGALPNDDMKFIHWKDFDRALLSDQELYRKVISLGKSPDHRLKDDLRFSKLVPLFGDRYNGEDYVFYKDNSNGLLSNSEKQTLHYNNI